MSKGKILIIDDDPDMALAIRLCLEGAGYQVAEAHNSADGLAKVKADTPDLIVLDVMMETTTEGFQIALTLRDADPNSDYAAYRKIPIIMLTSIHSRVPMRFGPDEDYLPVDEFVDKPLNPVAFVALVQKWLPERA